MQAARYQFDTDKYLRDQDYEARVQVYQVVDGIKVLMADRVVLDRHLMEVNLVRQNPLKMIVEVTPLESAITYRYQDEDAVA